MELGDRRLALEIQKLIDRRIRTIERNEKAQHRWGTVFGAADTVRRTVAVQLNGLTEPSPGFTYLTATAPNAGDHVLVVIDPKGDRYVLAIADRDVVQEIVDNVTPPVVQPDRARGIPVRVPGVPPPPTIVQQSSGVNDRSFSSPITPGNTLVYVGGKRSGPMGTGGGAPLNGYTVSPGGQTTQGDDYVAVLYKAATGSESTTLGLSSDGLYVGTWLELEGACTPDAYVLGSGNGNGTLQSAGPLSVVGGSFVLAATIWGTGGHTGGAPNQYTPGTGWTELVDSPTDSGGPAYGHPATWVGYRATSAPQSVTGEATSTFYGFLNCPLDCAWAMQVVSFIGPTIPDAVAYEGTDGDDATYLTTTTRAEAWRIDLGAAYRIVRARIVLGCATAGAKTYTLRAATQGDYSDEVTVATLSFTAAGAYATNVLSPVWPSTTPYRFWRLVGPAETRRVMTVELYEQTAGETIVTNPVTGAGSSADAALAALATTPAGPLTLRYVFSSTTADTDPGPGNLRLSNATQYLAVTVRADLTDADGADVTALLGLIASSAGPNAVLGWLRIQHRGDPSKWLVATVSAVASPSGYRNITIANVAKSANSPFTDGDPIVLSFLPVLTNPATTSQDLLVAGSSGVLGRLGKGSDGQVLTVDPATHLLVWATPAAGGGNVSAAAAITTDYGMLNAIKPRAVTNTEDDDFDSGSLAAKWLAFTNADATADLATLPGWLGVTQGGSGFKIQAVPAGDWTIEGMCIPPSKTATSFEGAEMILTDGTNATSSNKACRYVFGQANSLTQYRLNVSLFTNNAFTSTYTDYGFTAPINFMCVRIVKSGTTYAWEWSSNFGKSWQRFGSTSSLGFVPTHFGLGGAGTSYWNWFRRY